MFVLETMHWPDEIRAPEFEELDKRVDVRDTEVKMARQLIQQLSGEWRPEEFEDEYRVRLQQLAEQKVEGQEITLAEVPSEEPGQVVDLMEALKASVADAKQRRAERDADTDEGSKPARKASAS